MNNKDKKKEFIDFYIEDFLSVKGISFDNPQDIHISKKNLSELSEIFLDSLLIGGKNFIEVVGWLQWIYGCLLQKFYEASKKHEGKRISDIPEMQELYKDVDEFKAFVSNT